MDINLVLEENKQLKQRVSELEEKLKSYTNPDRNKKYYENNKDKFIESSNKRLEKLKETNPDKLKEYRQRAYLKRKCNGLQLCISCKLTNKNPKYNNHCFRCYVYLFPDQPVSRNYKTKETAVAQFITSNFPNFTWNLDKKLKMGVPKDDLI